MNDSAVFISTAFLRALKYSCCIYVEVNYWETIDTLSASSDHS